MTDVYENECLICRKGFRTKRAIVVSGTVGGVTFSTRQEVEVCTYCDQRAVPRDLWITLANAGVVNVQLEPLA